MLSFVLVRVVHFLTRAIARLTIGLRSQVRNDERIAYVLIFQSATALVTRYAVIWMCMVPIYTKGKLLNRLSTIVVTH